MGSARAQERLGAGHEDIVGESMGGSVVRELCDYFFWSKLIKNLIPASF